MCILLKIVFWSIIINWSWPLWPRPKQQRKRLIFFTLYLFNMHELYRINLFSLEVCKVYEISICLLVMPNLFIGYKDYNNLWKPTRWNKKKLVDLTVRCDYCKQNAYVKKNCHFIHHFDLDQWLNYP